MLDSMLLKEEYVFPGWMVRGIDFCYVVLLVNRLYITQYVFWLPMILIETFQNLKRWFLPFFFFTWLILLVWFPLGWGGYSLWCTYIVWDCKICAHFFCFYPRSSVAKHLESANTMFSFIWWIIGFYWVSAGGQDLARGSPQLYWYFFLFSLSV